MAMQTAAGTMWLMVPSLLTEASFSEHGFKVPLSVGPWQQAKLSLVLDNYSYSRKETSN